MKDPEPVGYYGPSSSTYVHATEKEPAVEPSLQSNGNYSFKFMYIKVKIPHNRPPRA
jgi:hypothetical protein